jgi:hypothetical protein
MPYARVNAWINIDEKLSARTSSYSGCHQRTYQTGTAVKAHSVVDFEKQVTQFCPPIVLYGYLQPAVDALVYGMLKMTPQLMLTEAVRFFLYEVPKVLLLLTLIVFGVGIIRSYFSAEKTRRILEGRSTVMGNILASLLGIVTPFCSCSAVPLFIGFVEAGVPLGVTFSFLIAAPMINEIALVLLFGLFGWKTALLYVSTGLLIAITSGFVIGS